MTVSCQRLPAARWPSRLPCPSTCWDLELLGGADIRPIVEDEPTNTKNKPPAAASGDGLGVGPGNYLAADMTRSGRPPMVDLEIYSSGAGVCHLLLWHGDAHAHGAHLVATLPDTAGIGRCKLKFTKTRCYRGDSESLGTGRCRAIAS